MQIVAYEPATDETPGSLVVSDAGHVDRIALRPGTVLSYALGERSCAGRITSAGHQPCERPQAPWCREHDETWICARCTGTCLKDEMDCLEEHAIYLAAFAPDVVKVGVTKRHRLETRLREQGADRAAHIRTVPDGRLAREIEAQIAEELGDAVRIERKMAGLHREVDLTWWGSLLEPYEVLRTFDLSYGLDLSSRPVRETIAAGTIRGAKGRLLVLDRGNTTYGVDMRALLGHTISPTDSFDRELQSSLDAFG